MKKQWVKAIEWIIEEDWRAFLILFIFLSAFYFFLKMILIDEFADELVKYVGLLLDVLFFGIIIGYYQTKTRRKKRILEYYEQLIDYATW